MSTPEYTVRLATVADVPAALAMKLAAWREAYAGLRPQSFFDAAEERREGETDWWTRGLEAGAQLWIAEDRSGRIVGCAGGGPAREEDADAGTEAELQMLYVLAEAQGAGVGRMLMDAAIGAQTAHLWVLEENRRAQEFYREHGFAPDGRREELAAEWEGLCEVRMVRGRG